MSGDPESSAEQPRAGLCATCTHSRRIESSRGSLFYLCQLSASDPRFRKYPPLPVDSCPGYAPAESKPRTSGGDDSAS
jgi:hypothetical protein